MNNKHLFTNGNDSQNEQCISQALKEPADSTGLAGSAGSPAGGGGTFLNYGVICNTPYSKPTC